MANSESAKKRIRQDEKRQARNRSYRTRMRNAIKNLRSAVDTGDAAKAKELLVPTLSIVDVTAQKGVIHDNAAARTKSRLTKAVNALA